MIDKLNFYDVYGYLLPGLGLLGLIWLPFGLFKHQWPATELSSALAVVVYAYVVGHIMQIFAVRSFPSQLIDPFGNMRHPSDLFLDRDQTIFSEDFKASLAKIVREAFNIDLAIERAPGKKDDREFGTIMRSRRDAFFLSRGVLIREKIAGYAEQFQGMYTLMRGLTTAFVLGFTYFAGWSLSFFKGKCLTTAAVELVIVGLLAALVAAVIVARTSPSRTFSLWFEKMSVLALMFTFAGIGYLFGLGTIESPRQSGALGAMSIVALILSLRCFGSYKSFAQEFAKAIWRDFAGHRMGKS